jgi:DNA segregation ATPase FtsK/SpoIIIE, S-DNA-T family
MSMITIRRGQRRKPPEMPGGEILLESPPEVPEVVHDSFQQTLTYLPILAMTAGMTVMIAGPGGGALRLIGGGAMALGMGGMMIGQMGRGKGERKVRLNGARRDYLRYLGQVRRQVRKIGERQRAALEWASPDPRALPALVCDAEQGRIWERRPADPDFLTIRLGTGSQRLAVRLIPPETRPVEDLDPLCSGALRRFVRAHASLAGLPVGISMRSFARIKFDGDTEAVYAMIRAMIAQIAVFHSPDDVRVSVCADSQGIQRWQWIKWLPHNMHPTDTDATGPARMMTASLQQHEGMLGAEIRDRPRFVPGGSQSQGPFHVVILDGDRSIRNSQLAADGVQGVVILDIGGTTTAAGDPGTLRLRVGAGKVEKLGRNQAGAEVPALIGAPDGLTLIEADALARQLAPMRPPASGAAAEDALAANTSLTSLLGIDHPQSLDVARVWAPRPVRNRLRVPIGTDADGQPVELDIKESAQGGMGPHGLIIGATGSGKSELLRTLVLGLALTHSSEVLNFVLVDFKGGATFLGLESLRHVSAVITNLEDELPLVDRMRDALHGEMVRRQEVLRSAGNHASLRDYEKARENGAKLAALPTLFVVIDEFSELLSAKPEFIDIFVMIGRLGRSLGVHLLLASQRLEEGRLRGLDTQLSYRVGLRTFSAMESRTVLGVPDAFELPSQPGNGYLKFEATGMTRFKAAYVSGPPTAAAGPRDDPTTPHPIQPTVVPFSPAFIKPKVTGRPRPAASTREKTPDGQSAAGSLLDITVRQLASHGVAAHQIWLPPLDDPPTLDQLVPSLAITPGLGFTADGWEGRGKLHAVAGIVDRPFDQRRDPFWLDLSGAAGHVGVAGGPQSGKSTVVRSLIASLALLHTPLEVQFYCLDLGGGTLGALADLPQVGGVATRMQGEKVRRTVAEMETLLDERERQFAERGIDSIASYRRMRASGEFPGDGFGDVFLVVDGWLTFRQEYEALEQAVTSLAARGLGYGIHVVAATNKWSEFRPAIRDLFGTRLELRLGDTYESEVGRPLAANVPEGSPGRGLTREGLHFLAALPRIDGQQRADSLASGVRQMVQTVNGAWNGQRAPVVRLLPEVIPATALPGPAETGARIAFGIDETSLAPVFLDFADDPHLLVFGDTECGKSNLLNLIAQGVAARHAPAEARMIFIDYRRSLLDAAEVEHQIGYAASSAGAASLVNDIRESLVKRLPPADLTPDQLRSRSWWKGADLFLIVDDYDLVAGVSNPLSALADLLPQARDIGLHLILARSAGGAGRALFDPVIQRVREMGSPGLVMSGSKDEGALLGGIKPRSLVRGRGYFVQRRGDPKLVQTALAVNAGGAGDAGDAGGVGDASDAVAQPGMSAGLPGPARADTR